MPQNLRKKLRLRQMFRISRDYPAFYLTAVTKDRLPIFRTDALAQKMVSAIDEARHSGKFLIFAYVIMLDHIHLVTDSKVDSKDIFRFVKGIASRRIIDYLKENGHEDSLEKLRVQHRNDGSDYIVWQRHPNTRLLWSEQMLWQRIQYTHLNPVRSSLVNHPNDWKWSSARIWHRRPLENEPLEVDSAKIEWHR
jgi:REP element-mobilizing transposase RayT